MPPCTRGSRSADEYWRRPGFDTQRMPADHGLACLGVLQPDPQYLELCLALALSRAGRLSRLLDPEVLYVALLLKHARELLVQPRGRHEHVLVVRAQRVAYAGQAVCYRVTHSYSPGRLRHAGDHALVRDLAQADPAQAELAVVRARPAAPAAPIVVAGLVLASALLSDDSVRSLPLAPSFVLGLRVAALRHSGASPLSAASAGPPPRVAVLGSGLLRGSRARAPRRAASSAARRSAASCSCRIAAARLPLVPVLRGTASRAAAAARTPRRRSRQWS